MEASSLQSVFNTYSPKKEMDGKTYVKILKDSGIIDKVFSTTDADLNFAKFKTSSSVRVITFAQFEKSLGAIATKKKCTAEDLVAKITETGGPQFQGTKADNVKFHDDPSQYTGSHSGKATGGTQLVHEETKEQPVQKQPAEKKESKTQDITTGEAAGSLQEVFNNFTANAKDMDGKTFSKCLKDCHIYDKKMTATDADLIFAKCKTKELRKISYDQFLNGLKLVADKKGITVDELNEKMMASGGPTYNATKADKVKFHDDKSLYTGVYANGGPTNVDKDKIKDISQLCDRTDADVRGIKK